MISVVVPVYNVKEYLQRCVESLLEQSYKDYEIILVDDGSSDGSAMLCDKWESFENITIFHKENGGLASARNYGVGHAKGEWITFVDSDDYVSSTYLEDLHSLVTKFNADMAITRVELQEEKNVGIKRKKQFEDFVVDKEGAFYEVYIGDKVGWSGCGKLIKKSTLLKFPFVDGFYEDSASAYRFIDDCNRIAIGDYSNNYCYIKRDGSITASELSDKHYRIFSVSEEIEIYINEKFPQKEYYSVMIYQNAVLQLLNRLSMPWSTYKKIFLMYRHIFRKNIWEIFKKCDVTNKSKVLLIILCTYPQLLWIFNKVKMMSKRK